MRMNDPVAIRRSALRRKIGLAAIGWGPRSATRISETGHERVRVAQDGLEIEVFRRAGERVKFT